MCVRPAVRRRRRVGWRGSAGVAGVGRRPRSGVLSAACSVAAGSDRVGEVGTGGGSCEKGVVVVGGGLMAVGRGARWTSWAGGGGIGVAGVGCGALVVVVAAAGEGMLRDKRGMWGAEWSSFMGCMVADGCFRSFRVRVAFASIL